MPDLTRSIDYGLSRIFSFNDVTQDEGTSTQVGCVVDEVTYGEVEVAGYTEKRSLDDGHDATDVYLGRRRITLRGTIYGRSKGDLFDRLREMRYAINPRLAYEESPGDKGYLPLAFWEPTEELATYDEGLLNLMFKARASSGVVTSFRRDAQGGPDASPNSAPYAVTFEAADPRVYARERSTESLSGAEGTLELVNRGGHPAPINLVLVNEADADHAFTFTMTVGGVPMAVTFPAGTGTQVIRVDGYQKVVTLQEEDVERLAQHHLDLSSEWAAIPRGETSVVWTFLRDDDEDGDLEGNSLLWYRETYS